MVLWIVDCFAKLSPRHYLVIVVTVVVPVVFPTVMGYFPIECLWVRVAVDAVLIVSWSVFVVVVVSKLVERDASEANRLVKGQVDPLTDQLDRLQEEHSGFMQDIRLQVEDLEARTQSALGGLDADLPPRTINLRATATSGSPTASARLTVSGGTRWARIKGWSCRAWLGIWGFVWGARRGSD